MKQIINLFGETTNTTGVISFTGQPGIEATEQVVIPQGTKLRIYRIAVDGEPITIKLQYTPNTSTWYTLEQVTTTASGHYVDEYKSRPLVVYGMEGTEEIQVAYSQSSVGGTAVAILAELVEAEEGED